MMIVLWIVGGNDLWLTLVVAGMDVPVSRMELGRSMLEIAFELDEHSTAPVFLQLSRVIIAAIDSGRLEPGRKLPGTRALAMSLRIHRNTVDAAYHEAVMQGWLVAEPSRGTFVARDLPAMPTAGSIHLGPAAEKGRVRSTVSLPTCGGPPMLFFSDGAPDARLLPRAELARAFRRALTTPEFLRASGYGDPRGALALREALCEHLSAERGLALAPADILVTRGSQMALFLAAGALLERDEVIAVEEPGYPLAVTAFRAAGARVVGVPVDADGLSVEHLERLAVSQPKLRAVYVTPHHQYPTTVTMGAGRRIRLLDVARRHGLTIVEDDYDHEYRFDGKPVLPLASRAGDVPVLYVGSLSKVLAPGIRLGYATGPVDLLQRMADDRQAIDRQGDVPLEHAVAILLREGDLGRHARKTRRIYQARRDLLARSLTSKLGAYLDFAIPPGGLALWTRLLPGLDAERWSHEARRHGLAVTPAMSQCLDLVRAPQAFRLGFASLDEVETSRAVEILAITMP
ncbi:MULTISPECIES: PLP-dependent aminotransferase family protein [unclassified Aureimonas]|uniref:MocR-like pyridoxine biosynthesis transcription factor PdxR n=1 Tax=unclassified Aureimonas TaxID=2615206 RepID=UPI001FCD024B|nr:MULTISPECIES: PLP-dependent aminotransferase family protein [unclassified Aureimonas]